MLDEPQFWRDRAEKFISSAASTKEPEMKRVLLRLADACERLADQSEKTSEIPLSRVEQPHP